MTHPRTPLVIPHGGSGLGRGELADGLAGVSLKTEKNQVYEFISVLRHVRDAMAESQDVQKEQADKNGRVNLLSFEVGDLVLLNSKNLPTNAAPDVFKTKLKPWFGKPYKVIVKK